MSYHRIVTLKGQKDPGEIVWLVLEGCGGQRLRDRDRVRETNLGRGNLDPYLGLAPLFCPEATEFQRNPEMGLQVSQSLKQGLQKTGLVGLWRGQPSHTWRAAGSSSLRLWFGRTGLAAS